MFFTRLLLVSVTVIIFLATFASGATLLPSSEEDALKQIGKTLGKNDWNFSVDPCSGESGWANPNAPNGFQNAVTCGNCSSDNTTCHVVSIVLKSLNLSGILPRELVNLPYLQEFDISRNYVNGTIPREWSSLPLVDFSLYGNRVTGLIPAEFGNISTLKSLVLEFNQLSGTLPQELGNLSNIERLCLTSNYFFGELPETLAKLTTLKDFRIEDNNFTGSIPNFIQNWIHLEYFLIQGSGLDGPIPSGIAFLTNMTQLRISDLNGTVSAFPPLSNMNNLVYLVLKSCNIIGSLPEYLGTKTKLKTLDLSFNKLSGEIPRSFVNLSTLDSILTLESWI